LALGTNNRLTRVADRAHSVNAQLAGAKDDVDSAAMLAVLQTRAQLLLRALRCFLPWSRIVRQFCAYLDLWFYRGVLRLAIGISDGGRYLDCVRNISLYRAGLRLCLNDPGNAARSRKFDLGN
jgi:hypothetical protein